MKIGLKKFGTIPTSRPAGRDAGLTIKAYFKPEPNEQVELDRKATQERTKMTDWL